MTYAKFRKKPVVVEAEQYLPAEGQVPFGLVRVDNEAGDVEEHICPTIEGPLSVTPGDWIIRGVRGELYPCKPEIFAETYVPA